MLAVITIFLKLNLLFKILHCQILWHSIWFLTCFFIPCIASNLSTATSPHPVCVPSLGQCFLKCPGTRSSSSVTWKLVWNANYWAIFLVYWIINWEWGIATMLISLQWESDVCYGLRTTAHSNLLEVSQIHLVISYSCAFLSLEWSSFLFPSPINSNLTLQS